ncbi:hypothetical protein FNYG_08633 [Fusarium nygamai]|uniref:JmjC domain-containing protein n=1 Tax=Gibberella nygamai TaxID=42673 RepID=A0A2K0W6K1_GIBNY|nr:hypothetical protein FNYG_08633 [Fusarium nygamai]
MSSHDFLISKCDSLLMTAEQLFSTLTALCSTVRTEASQKNRPTQFATRVAEPSDDSATNLLWRILSELNGLADRSQALQSQVEDISGIISRCNNSNTANWEDGKNATHTVSQSTQPPTASGSDQQADIPMLVSESIAARPAPFQSPEAEGDNINRSHATQAPTTPSPARQNPRASPNARPDSSTSTSSYTARHTSPAGSDATHLTWPESTTWVQGQDMARMGAESPQDDEQAQLSSAGNLNAPTSRCKWAITNHQRPRNHAADDTATSPDPHQPPMAVNGASTSGNGEPNIAVAYDGNPSQVVEDTFMTDSNIVANPLVQIHSPEGEYDNDVHDQQIQFLTTPSPSREEGDLADEAVRLGTRRESTPPTSTTTTRSMPSSISGSSVSQATTTLSSADMEKLVPKLAELEREGVGQHISVPRLNVDLADIQECVNGDNENWQYTSMRYGAGPEGQGYARVYTSGSKTSIDWPAFTAEVKRPTAEEARAIFENIVQNPPEGEFPYYVGHANILSDKPLNPGPIITEKPAFKDLHTQFHHISGHLSANRIRCEDMTSVEQTSTGPTYRGLRSYNEVYFGTGYKLWLAIAKHHIAKFDAFVKANWKCNKCNQAVAHQNLLLAPSRLEKEGIDYIIAVVGHGEAFWTLPGQQHATVNFGYCAARSIYHSHPEDKLNPQNALQCSDCGMFKAGIECGATTVLALALGSSQTPLVSTPPNRKRKAHQKLSKTFCKMIVRTNAVARRELDKIEGEIAVIPYRSPQIDRQNPSLAELDVYKRVAAVRSKLAVQQFTDLVREWRQKQSTVTVDPTKHSLDQAMVLVKHYTGKARLQILCLRLAQRRLAQESDKVKGPIQLNHQPTFLDNLASRHGITKAELKGHLRDGRQWDRVCGVYDGLLPFILLDTYNDFGISKREWLMLGHKEHVEEADTFHNLLNDDYIKNISAAGKVFEEMISGVPVVFLWEESGIDPTADNVDVLLKQCLAK